VFDKEHIKGAADKIKGAVRGSVGDLKDAGRKVADSVKR
jgi:uncharacterized protein YjbJ (UPF0337 family)